MTETHFRAKYRQLQWHMDVPTAFSVAVHTEEKAFEGKATRSCSTASVAESQVSFAESESCGEDEDEDDSTLQRACNQKHEFTLERFRQPDLETEDVPSLHPDNSSNATPSIASWSSKNTNPFRKSTEIPRLKARISQSPTGFSQNIWDDPILQ